MNRCRLGARLDDGGQHVLLLLGVALHGRDQVRDEIGAALILVLHVGPFGLRLLLERRDRVVAAARQAETEKDDCEDRGGARESHGSSPNNGASLEHFRRAKGSWPQLAALQPRSI